LAKLDERRPHPFEIIWQFSGMLLAIVVARLELGGAKTGTVRGTSILKQQNRDVLVSFEGMR
jgi:hypothetical protein